MSPSDSEPWQTAFLPPRALQAVGRIIELDALLEALGRDVLGEAAGLSSNAAEALFLGDRFNQIEKRLKGLQALKGAPGEAWLPEAVQWASKVSKLQERRNALVHRPPVWLVEDDDDEPRLGWGRARSVHRVQPAEAQPLLDLISEMESAYREGLDKHLGSFFSDSPAPWTAAP